MNLGPPEIILIILAILLLFGYKKLPDASRSLGRSMRIFKGEMKGMKDDDPRTRAEAETVRGELSTPPAQAGHIPGVADPTVATPPPSTPAPGPVPAAGPVPPAAPPPAAATTPPPAAPPAAAAPAAAPEELRNQA